VAVLLAVALGLDPALLVRALGSELGFGADHVVGRERDLRRLRGVDRVGVDAGDAVAREASRGDAG